MADTMDDTMDELGVLVLDKDKLLTFELNMKKKQKKKNRKKGHMGVYPNW